MKHMINVTFMFMLVLVAVVVVMVGMGIQEQEGKPVKWDKIHIYVSIMQVVNK